MPESTDHDHTDHYTSAVDDLAHAIAEVWWVCEDGYDHDRGIETGANLAEALSYALGLAAVTLGLDRDDSAARVEGDRARMVAAEGLVCHRPGCWEADHVRALIFPPDLIALPERA